LEQLFLKLRKAELVRSTRGASGGYRLMRRLHELTYRDVIEALEGELPLPTARASGQFGEDAFVRAVYNEIMDAMQHLVLGGIVTTEMAKKAERRKAASYVYHI